MTQGIRTDRIAAGWFQDRGGRSWYVVFNDKGDARCNSEDGSFTAAYADTFRQWAWTRKPQP